MVHSRPILHDILLATVLNAAAFEPLQPGQWKLLAFGWVSSNRTQRNMVKLAFIAETIEGVNVCKILDIMSQNHALIPCSSGSWAACILSVSCIWSSEPLPPLLTGLLGSVSDGGALGGQLAVD